MGFFLSCKKVFSQEKLVELRKKEFTKCREMLEVK
jgi:hypothetical protein